MKNSLTNTKLRTIAAASIATLAMAAAGGSALAGGDSIPAEVNAKFNSNEFRVTGHVKSEGKCERQRLVKVYERLPGKDDFVGQDTTDSGGKFSAGVGGSINGSKPHYAKAPAKELAAGKTCLKAKSPIFIPNDN
jgi:hypothetical protein